MDVEQVKTFLVLAEELNFSRAAKILNVSQPTVSRTINSIETQLGGLLFRRERDKSHLTELGELVLPYFEEIEANAGNLVEVARKYRTLEKTPVSVGLMCTIGPERLIALITKIRELFAGVEVSITNGNARALQEMLNEGKLDLAICGRPKGFDERFHVVPLYQEKVMAVLNPEHPLAERNFVDLDDLDGLPYIDRTGCEFSVQEGNFLAEKGIKLDRIFSSDRDDWIQSMIREGIGISLMAQSAVFLPELAVRPIPGLPFTREIQMVTVRGRRHSAGIGAVLQAARQAFQQQRNNFLLPQE